MEYASTHSSVSISDLSPNITRPSVVGIIIGKTDARGFPDRKKVGSERFTFSFTIKDSPDHFINVSSWGTEEYIQGLCSHIKIGDCVVIENPLVATKDPEKEDRFCPTTPSFYRLLVTEAHSAIRMCTDLDTESRLLSVFHIPVKDSGDFYSLGDITANGQSLDGNFINILAAVRSIGEPKFFTTSAGRKGQKLEIKLFDETLTSFPFICDRCKFRVHEEIEVCTNTACPKQGQEGEVTADFDLLVDISDHTGTLQGCNLSGTVAEKTLGCTSKEFVCLSESDRTAMKWKFLLERCKIYVKVLKSTKSTSGMRTSILSCTLADPVEVKQSMSVMTS